MRLRQLLCCAIVWMASMPLVGNTLLGRDATWKVGTARAKMTPKEPMWMSGYGPRLTEKTLHDIWIKVLALESPDGQRGVIITNDVCGFSRQSYDAICTELRQRCGLRHAQIMLTCSHTHTGPALRECLPDCWPWNDPKARDLVERYSVIFEKTIVEKVAEALEKATPATIWAGEGTASFAVNRRNNREAEVPKIRERGEALKGPVDHSIPILAIRTPQGDLRAVAFGYACHTTTLQISEWSGDYAGFAMISLEKSHPGMDAMFFQTCGADQNPLPRRTVDLCRKYGDMLAAGVEDALRKPMRQIAPSLRTARQIVALDFKRNPTKEELEAAARADTVSGGLAKRYLKQLAEGKPLAKSHPYIVQAWKLGADQLWVSLSGEVVVDYSLNLKQKYGPQTWVNGYTHDLVAYIPSARVLNEGGGQEWGELWLSGLPAYEWAPDVETRVMATIDRLVRRLK